MIERFILQVYCLLWFSWYHNPFSFFFYINTLLWHMLSRAFILALLTHAPLVLLLPNSDSFLNTDSWDPFCIYWSWRDFMKKLSGQREWGCWQFPLECGCRCQGNQISLVVKGIRPFVCTCSQNICSVHGNNACGYKHHLVFLVLTQCLLWNYRW